MNSLTIQSSTYLHSFIVCANDKMNIFVKINVLLLTLSFTWASYFVCILVYIRFFSIIILLLFIYFSDKSSSKIKVRLNILTISIDFINIINESAPIRKMCKPTLILEEYLKQILFFMLHIENSVEFRTHWLN